MDHSTKADREQLLRDLVSLGLRGGDHEVLRLFLRFVCIPYPTKFLAQAVVLGPGGLLGLTFTRWFPLPLRGVARQYIFDEDIPLETGGLNRFILWYFGAVRNSRPINLFVGIRAPARELLADHGPESPIFESVRRFAEHPQGEMLLIVHLFGGPGFSTFHVVQHLLGTLLRSPRGKG